LCFHPCFYFEGIAGAILRLRESDIPFELAIAIPFVLPVILDVAEIL
jgi:hypothetical protein